MANVSLGLLTMLAAPRATAELSAGTEKALRESGEIYIATQRASGERSSIKPVWFYYLGDDELFFTTSPGSWKAKRIARGSPLYIWVGSDDGLVHLTRDDGATWTDVTPGDLGGAMVNAIEVSPFEPGTAYVAVSGYKLNDFRPYIYKLTDYGQSSSRIDSDLPQDNFIRVVRADPVRAGLLYAGGEGGLYVSFDDGGHWQSLQLNLPQVPITDLAIRQGDLVAATQGRSFWVLDDLKPLRDVSRAMAEKPIHLFAPSPVEMIKGRRRSASDHEGSNPEGGVVLAYHLRERHEGSLTIEIRDAAGELVRRYSSQEGDFERCILGNMDQRLPFEVDYPARQQGANVWVWDMRRTGLRCIDEVPLFEGFSGAYVVPGTYRARISVGDVEDSTEFTLIADRRVDASAAEFAELDRRIVEITDLMNSLLDRLAAVRKSRERIEELMAGLSDAEAVQRLGGEAIDRLTAWERKVLQVDFETYEDEDSMPGKLVKQVRHLLDVIDQSGPPVAAGALERLADLQAEWATLEAELAQIHSDTIAAINRWARESSIPHVPPPN